MKGPTKNPAIQARFQWPTDWVNISSGEIFAVRVLAVTQKAAATTPRDVRPR